MTRSGSRTFLFKDLNALVAGDEEPEEVSRGRPQRRGETGDRVRDVNGGSWIWRGNEWEFDADRNPVS